MIETRYTSDTGHENLSTQIVFTIKYLIMPSVLQQVKEHKLQNRTIMLALFYKLHYAYFGILYNGKLTIVINLPRQSPLFLLIVHHSYFMSTKYFTSSVKPHSKSVHQTHCRRNGRLMTVPLHWNTQWNTWALLHKAVNFYCWISASWAPAWSLWSTVWQGTAERSWRSTRRVRKVTKRKREIEESND